MLQVVGYAIAVATLLSAVGFAAEQMLARWGLPRRAAWSFAMLASMLFPLLMMSRVHPVPAAVVHHPATEPAAVPAAAIERLAEPAPVPAQVPAAVPAPAPAAVPATAPAASLPARASSMPMAEPAAHWLPPLPSDRLIFTLWIAASSVLLLYVCGTSALLHYRASKWRRESLLGHEVLVSVDTGPALLGALRPRIVMPRWCLDESAETRLLILQHEQQHVAGRDPLLLWVAVLVVVALPWNLPLWWQLRRLRLAIELDCDARVLCAGVDVGCYGEVLLAVTQRAAGLRGVAIAMGQPVSALERRIRNLSRVSQRHAGLRVAGSLLTAVAGAAAAAMLKAPVMPGAGHGGVPLTVGTASPVHALAMQGAAAEKQPAPASPLPQMVPTPTVGETRPLPSSRRSAQNPLACIDQDLLRGLLLQPASQALSVGTASPPELAAFKVPRELRWIATAERSYDVSLAGSSATRTSSVAAVYRANLQPEAAGAAAAAALTAGGWKQSDDRPLGNNVFASGYSMMNSETYCREGKPVRVMASALDGVTYVTLTMDRNLNTSAFVNACDQPLWPFVQPSTGLDKYLPKFQLPRDPATGQPVSLLGSGGGGGGEARRRFNASFVLKDSAANVATYFARQMIEQGWSADTSWSGRGTAGSTWTRKPDADTALQATLTVSAFDEGRFTVIFNAVTSK